MIEILKTGSEHMDTEPSLPLMGMMNNTLIITTELIGPNREAYAVGTWALVRLGGQLFLIESDLTSPDHNGTHVRISPATHMLLSKRLEDAEIVLAQTLERGIQEDDIEQNIQYWREALELFMTQDG